mmetsp:Transcript_109780/g.321421  ORF Transcript_109780/g.321421 Transcript_109780/m.321421 type:complete len:302 (-) Transcript_109780:332-1237(-)
MGPAILALRGGHRPQRAHVLRAQAAGSRLLCSVLRRTDLHELVHEGRALWLPDLPGRRPPRHASRRPPRHPSTLSHHWRPAVRGLLYNRYGELLVAADAVAVPAKTPGVAVGTPHCRLVIAILLFQHRPEQPESHDDGHVRTHHYSLWVPSYSCFDAALLRPSNEGSATQDQLAGVSPLLHWFAWHGTDSAGKGTGRQRQRQLIACPAGVSDLHVRTSCCSFGVAHDQLSGPQGGVESGRHHFLYGHTKHLVPCSPGAPFAAFRVARTQWHDRPYCHRRGSAPQPARAGPCHAVRALRSAV